MNWRLRWAGDGKVTRKFSSQGEWFPRKEISEGWLGFWQSELLQLGLSGFEVKSSPAWRRQWHPTPVLLPGKSHGWRSLVGCSPRGHWGSDTTEQLHFHFSLSWEEKEMATHSSVLAWRIPGMGEPGGLLSMGSHRVGHDWSDLAVAASPANFGRAEEILVYVAGIWIPALRSGIFWFCVWKKRFPDVYGINCAQVRLWTRKQKLRLRKSELHRTNMEIPMCLCRVISHLVSESSQKCWSWWSLCEFFS